MNAQPGAGSGSRLSGHEHGRRRELQPGSLAPDGARQHAYCYGIQTGDIVWIAGQVPRDRDGNLVGAGDAEAQAVQVFENIKAVVEAAGGSLADVVQTTTYITERPSREVVGAVRRRYFPGPEVPTATLLIVAGLGVPEYLVEIDAVAVLRG